MAAGGAAAVAIVAAFVRMVMGMVVTVEVIVLMGMHMVMAVGVGMLVGVGNTVMGVLMRMGMAVVVVVMTAGNMIMIQMHMDKLLYCFFLLYPNSRALSNRLPQPVLTKAYSFRFLSNFSFMRLKTCLQLTFLMLQCMWRGMEFHINR
jgi:hypothetical protein